MEEKYLYNAFISYRHLSPDKEAAEEIQNLLEKYVPPKAVGGRIKRVFRDATELPTSNDLDQSLQDALMGSEYLIPVISERTKESRWCMEEIRRFKEAHGGRIDHILPVLVQGEPADALPEELCWETVTQTLPDGTQTTVTKAVEPLCCDARAEDDKTRKKLLKREFLRLAASILGCGFDDLYQRHQRRKRKRLAVALSVGFAALAAVLLVVSYFAIQASRARDQYQANLVDTYLRQGAQKNAEGDLQQALMYYNEALALDPENETAVSGALLALQSSKWLRCESVVRAEAEDDPASASPSGQNAYYYGGLYSPPVDLSAYGEKLRSYADAPLVLYGDEEYLTLYDGAAGRICRVPRPTAENPRLTEDSEGIYDPTPLARVFGEDRLIVKYGGYLYLYQVSSWEETGEAGTLTDTLDLSTVFRDEYTNRFGLDIDNQMWVDGGSGLAVIRNAYSAAVMDLGGPTLNAVVTRFSSFLVSASFSPDGREIALVYGNPNGLSLQYAGGFVAVYSQDGRLIASTEEDVFFIPEQAAFSPDGAALLVYNSDSLRLADPASGALLCAPLYQDGIASAAFAEEGAIRVFNRYGSEYLYRLEEFCAASAEESPALEALSDREYDYELGGGLTLSRYADTLTVRSADGSTVSEQRSPLLFNRISFHPQKRYVCLWQSGREDLYRIPLDPATGILGTPEPVSTDGHPCGGLCCFEDYMAAVTLDHRILVYANTDTEARLSCTPGVEGNVAQVCGDGRRLLAILYQTSDFPDPTTYHFNTSHSIELWDISRGLLLNTLEGTYFTELAFHENGSLTCKDPDGDSHPILASAEADAALRELISGLTCFGLGDSQEPVLKSPMLSEAGAAAAAALFPPSADAEPDEAEGIDTAALDRVLEAQGADAWFAACDEIWTTRELTLEEMADFFHYCRGSTAVKDYGRLKTGFRAFSGAVAEDWGLTYYPAAILDSEIESILTVSDALDGEIAAYYAEMADVYDFLCQHYPENSPDYFTQEADYRFEQLYLQGAWPGTEAFRALLSDDPDGSLWGCGMNLGTAAMAALADGDAETAAALVNEEIRFFRDNFGSYYDSEEALLADAAKVVSYAWIFTRHGELIPEERLQEFLGALSCTVEAELRPIRWKDLNTGFRLGDYVTEAGGRRFACGLHARVVLEDLGAAEMTIIRDGRTIDTRELETPYVYGYSKVLNTD